MKKYSFLIFSLVFLLISLFKDLPSVQAAAGTQKDNQPCSIDSISANDPSQNCVVGFECKVPPDPPGSILKSTSGTCKPTNQQPVQCACEHENLPGPGNNGFTCGGPPIYCSYGKYFADTVCLNGGGNLDPSKVNFKGHEADYANKLLQGVMCSETKHGTAICSCDGGFNSLGKNTFACTLEGDTTNQKATGACKTPGDRCTNTPDKFTSTDSTSDYDGFLNGWAKNFFSDGYKIKGITCVAGPTPTLPPPPSPPCKQWDAAAGCTVFGSGVGDLQTEPTGFIKSLFAVLLSLSGGIALLLIIKSGYQLMTSQGKPDQIQAGRDQLVAAIVGLIFLVFSFILLQVIGYDVLRIPGFGK